MRDMTNIGTNKSNRPDLKPKIEINSCLIKVIDWSGIDS